MDLTLNKIDFKIMRSKIIIYINGVYAGKITKTPSSELINANKLCKKYCKMYDCLLPDNVDVTYDKLIKLYDIYKLSVIKPIKNTLTVFYKSEIVAVIVDSKKDFIGIDSEFILKSIAYFYVYSEFKPFFIEGRELLNYVRYLHF